jgi:beta-galactosidase
LAGTGHAMSHRVRTVFLTLAALFEVVRLCHAAEDSVVSLPAGVIAVWDLTKAYRESTSTRERVCLNGLWQWQPAAENKESEASVPAGQWGWFKVPGCWPGITDYMQKDCQTVFAHPAWKSQKLAGISAAWYQRQITIPSEWTNRRVTLSAEYVNSFATIYVDGQKAAEIRFPGGEADITAACRPGRTHQLGLLVVAMPLKGVLMSYADTFGAKQVQGKVERRGLCGDVYLVGTPAGARLEDVKVSTSVRKWEISFEAGVKGLNPDGTYVLRAEVGNGAQTEKEFTSRPFKARELHDDRIAFAERWKPEKLWDTHTPQNMHELRLSLLDANGKLVDAALPQRFGFRELWIDGRDFYLNGSRIFLCAVPFDNAQIGAAWATYDGARDSMQRLKTFGVNFVYTHNYGCEPGTHLSFAEILRAADDEGMLVSFSQPHFAQYDWKTPEADRSNGYARHAEFYVRAAGNHPSVVFYGMSHNATGTEEEMNPDMIDGIHDVRNQWSANNARQALRAQAIVQRLDPSRIVYHHSSGNLGSMHTANFYANFAPVQEMSDWFEHWATKGVKPLFLCEYGVPIFWDWMMYRGWYEGKRTFGEAKVPWEFCLAEWDAQFLGDAAYFRSSDLQKECARWEAKRFQAGQTWHRWDYPRDAIESPDFIQRNEVVAMYLSDNLRAFRTWGISAFCPWDHGTYWNLRPNVKRERKELKVDWDKLQRPGFSPDYVDGQMEWMNSSFEANDWGPTEAGLALIVNNQPLLAYIAGKAAAFTSKDHNFYPGDLIEKQLIIINNSRQTVVCDCSWSLKMSGLTPDMGAGRKQLSIETGQQARLPLAFTIPQRTTPGIYQMMTTLKFADGSQSSDSFFVDVLPRPARPHVQAKLGLFDPKGETARLLRGIGAQFKTVEATDNLSGIDILIVGKGALTRCDAAPDISRVRDGLKVVMFEQTSEVLEQRFGFRIAEYGLRKVVQRVPDHPLLAGIGEGNLHDWRGEATLLPPRLQYELGPRHAPEVKWCDIPVTRLWRAGNRGNVASVLIEKPARGDFMPILDGGFSLQFSPLLEYREGQGMILFCQMDVTGRTESDPAAERLAVNTLEYADSWKPAPTRGVLYAGNAAGKRHLELAGIVPQRYRGGQISTSNVLVVAAGGGKELAGFGPAVDNFIKAGGHVLCIGLDEDEASAFLPFKVRMEKAEHISCYFERFGKDSFFAGIGPADVYNHDPRTLPLVAGVATFYGDGVLAKVRGVNVFFCQMAPYDFSGETANIRRTFRRASFALNRLLANLGGDGPTPILQRFRQPVENGRAEARWGEGLYLDTPEEWDDPYRFFCW